MIGRQFFNKVAATVAVTGMLFSLVPNISWAAAILKNGDTVDGRIRNNSPSFRFRNELIRNTPIQTAPGEEYIFNAQRGDTIQVSVQVDEGSNLSPVLVLINTRTGRQVAYDDTSNSLRYRVPAAGEYRLLVLGENNSRGRYTLSISGITDSGIAQNPSTQTTSPQGRDQRRQFLQNEYGLRVLDNCPADRSSLVRVTFNEYGQTYTYCANPNRAVKAGDYTYDVSSNDLKPAGSVAQTPSTQTTDRRREFLQNEYGLRVLDNCPVARGSLVAVNFTEYGQTSTYCANPNRLVKAGEYTYDPSSNELRLGAPTAQNPYNSATDPRRQQLQNDFGLTVLDSCPAARSSLVVVTMTDDSGQTYTYCANPNRFFAAGEYTYNPNSRNLDLARKPQQCNLQVGGICIVK